MAPPANRAAILERGDPSARLEPTPPPALGDDAGRLLLGAGRCTGRGVGGDIELEKTPLVDVGVPSAPAARA